MFDEIFRYAVRHPGRAVGALASDPLGMWDKVHDRIVQRREYRDPVHRHAVTAHWERKLHACLGEPWPCEAAREFDALWPEAVAFVARQGIRVGPESFNGYNDGDTALVRAIWCLVRHCRPAQVVETGVAHGFTSRFILEALARNAHGHLSSIDRPPLDPAMRNQVGIAVDSSLAARWSLIAGSSRRCLPPLLAQLGTIDLFVHDSLHTERNVRFELDRAWAQLSPGGALVVDDIDTNAGFASFLRDFPGHAHFACEAEPVRPDERRFNGKGLFGIVLKARENP